MAIGVAPLVPRIFRCLLRSHLTQHRLTSLAFPECGDGSGDDDDDDDDDDGYYYSEYYYHQSIYDRIFGI